VLTPQQFLDEFGWVPIGTPDSREIGDIDIEDDPAAPAPVGTKYKIIGHLSRAEAVKAAFRMGLRVQERYNHFYKAVVE
jgi:hypothetical protein